MEALAGTVPPKPPVPTRDGLGHWDLSGATAYQKRLRSLVETKDRLGPVRVVAGADVSYARGDARLYAAVLTLDASTLRVLVTTGVRAVAGFPYLPGYLSFREAPAVVEAFASLEQPPDLLLVDGHGVAHPRGFGLACHLGVLLDLPTIGVAKTILVGETDDPAQARGSRAPLTHRGKRLGTTLRTRSGVKPVYVSVGHRVSLRTAERLALECTGRFRIPEPTRRAHQEVNRLRREDAGGRSR